MAKRKRKPQVKRSPHWPAVRRAHLKREPVCQVCGSKSRLEVHHKRPYHLFPSLELVDSNLITLCEGNSVNCHLAWGHLWNWHDYNPVVEKDAATWRRKIARRLAA